MNEVKKGITTVNTMTRCQFIKGAFAAAGGLACPGWLATAATQFAQGECRLRFGVLSDVHIRSSSDITYFKRALEYFRENAVDAVMICGDIADTGRVDELQMAANAWFEIFPENKLPNGATVEKLFVSGNHDWDRGTYTFTKNDPTLLRYDFRNNWKTIWKEDSYSKIWQKTVKGYVFIGNHWDCTDLASEVTDCWHNVAAFDDLPAYLSAHQTELSGAKPFFYLQHSQQKNTCFGGRAWGEDTGVTTTALLNFPNAVTFSGHSHYSLTDDRSIWQGGFTAVNAGSLSYTGLDDTDPPSGDIVYENGYTGNAKTMPRYAQQKSGKQGMLVSVYDDAIVYHRCDFYGTVSRTLGEDWVQPLPAADHPTAFSPATRAVALAAPQFPSGARLTATGGSAKTRGNVSVPATTFTFPAANAGGGFRPYYYEVKFIGSDTANPVMRYVLAQGFNAPLSDASAVGNSMATLAASIVPAGKVVRVVVTPLSAFGTRGASISALADGDALRAGAAVFKEGLSVIGF